MTIAEALEYAGEEFGLTTEEACRDRTEALMRYRLSSAWPMGAVLCPAGTVIDANANDRWSQLAKGKTIPINATPLDDEAWQAQLRAYPDQKHLLGGGWQ